MQNIADEICKHDRLNIYLKSKSLEDTDQVTETEEWYSTKYSVADFTDDIKAKILTPKCEIKSKKLDLPPPNNLIPKNFDVLDANESYSSKVQILKQWEDTDLWYKKDDKFQRPKAVVNMKLYTNDCDFGFNNETRVFASVWQNVQNEYLREFNYMADCANLHFAVSVMYDNIGFTWSGFNDSMPNYITESISKLQSMPQEDLRQIFDQVKEKLMIDWKNCYLIQSYQ